MKTKITSSPKSSNKHSYRQTLSTSSDFSRVQPTFFRPMLAKSTLDVNIKQFVRLMPLPFPTFGKIKLCNAARFVPIEQIYPAYAAFMSEKEYLLTDGTSYIPKYMPTIKLCNLMAGILFQYTESTPYTNAVKGSNLTVPDTLETLIDGLQYKQNYGCAPFEVGESCGTSTTKEKTRTYAAPLDAALTAIVDKFLTGTETDQKDAQSEYEALMLKRGYKIGANKLKGDPVNAPTDAQLNSADYVARVGTATATPYHSIILYRYTSTAKSLFKALIGIGIQPSLDDYTDINILPLLGMYKAYFDRFYPTRLGDWMSTRTYRLIKFIEETDITEFYSIKTKNTPADSSNAGRLRDYFWASLDEVANMWVTTDLDYLSAQTRTIANGQAPNGYPVTSQIGTPNTGVLLGTYPDPAVIPSDSDNDTPNQHKTSDAIPAIAASANITKWQLDLLKRMTNYVVKDSLIGNRINLWMKAHLGEDVLNIIYHQTNDAGYSESDISIGDVDSTADTAASGGAYLGSYAGKGIGSNGMHVHFKANSFGYLYVFTWIEVETSWYQGTDAPFTANSRYQFPNPEFDALGYEVTPRTSVWTDNGISFTSGFSGSDDTGIEVIGSKQLVIGNQSGFGYMPRYSGWKYCKNIVNGDFRLRSMANGMRPFYVDKMFLPRTITRDSTDNHLVCGQYTLPLASSAWQYQERYPWLSYYNRIFANDNEPHLNPYSGYNMPTMPDNFLIHQVNDFYEINFLKPLSASYDVGKGNEFTINRS